MAWPPGLLESCGDAPLRVHRAPLPAALIAEQTDTVRVSPGSFENATRASWSLEIGAVGGSCEAGPWQFILESGFAANPAGS